MFLPNEQPIDAKTVNNKTKRPNKFDKAKSARFFHQTIWSKTLKNKFILYLVIISPHVPLKIFLRVVLFGS
jgi:hypothetical protein